MSIENEIKEIAFMNALAQVIMDAGITTAEALDNLAREKEKLLRENYGLEDG